MATLALPHDEDVHPPVLASDPLLQKVWNDYVEMPGLRLTRAQAQRLWAVDETTCKQLLDRLVQAKLLVIGADGQYARAPDKTTRPLSAARMLPAGSRRLLKAG